MNQTDHKPFVVIGNAQISPEELMELYGLTLEECHLGDEREFTSYMTVGKVIQLRPRLQGDYVEYLEQMLKEDWERTGGQIIKRARKKAKFRVGPEWAKQLKRRGKL